MRKKTRKKTWRTLLGFLLCIFTMTVCVWADEGTSQNPDYVTDYYMVVESPEGGIDIYSEADPQSTKLNGELIPNGIAIRIQGEKTGTDNKKWGYTQYHGMNGYVPMDNLDPVSRSEAVKSEYKVLGGQDADFDVKINSQDKAAEELNLIVDCGGRVKNISISHRVYGRVSAEMDIRSRQDVNEFITALNNSNSSALSNATSGYHYHLVEAASEERLDLIEEQLKKAGLLAPLQPWEQNTKQEGNEE